MSESEPQKCRNDGCSGIMKQIAFSKTPLLASNLTKLPTHLKCTDCGATVSAHRVMLASAEPEQRPVACTLSSRQKPLSCF